MKTVILCGGKGTRIRDVSGDLPKPMVRIGPMPIVHHIMGIYGEFGHNDFVLCLGYRGWTIKEYFLNFGASTHDVEVSFENGGHARLLEGAELPPWTVTLAETGLEAQTGSRIKQIERYVKGEPFMLTYGDGVGEVDLDRLLDAHHSSGALVTVTAVRPPARFGQLTINNDFVTQFAEKPQAEGGYINGGFFVCDPGVFEYLSEDEDCSFEGEPLRRIAEDGLLGCYRHDGFWMPMDTSREYRLLNEMWHDHRAPWASIRRDDR